MARGLKKVKSEAQATENPEVSERKRLKKLALKTKILSENAATAFYPLHPSKTLLRHHGTDIVKKSQRKSRYLFSFPGLIGPINSGRIGELKDLGSKNPVLYLQFPQGQLKLFGTIVFPKNRYLTLQFSKGGKNVMCEDYFDNMIVFSEAWWIGKKEENPDEDRLEFPKDLNEEHVEFNFKVGAGAFVAKEDGPVSHSTRVDQSFKPKSEPSSSRAVNTENDSVKATPIKQSGRNVRRTYNYVDSSSGDESDEIEDGVFEEAKAAIKETSHVDATPVRHSGRTAGRKYNFAESSSGDDPDEVEDETLEEDDEEATDDDVESTDLGARPAESLPQRSHVPLVQATISTLFKNAGKKASCHTSSK